MNLKGRRKNCRGSRVTSDCSIVFVPIRVKNLILKSREDNDGKSTSSILSVLGQHYGDEYIQF